MRAPVDERIAADPALAATITASTTRPDDFVTALASARFGSTAPRYRRINVDAQLDRLHDPVYFTLRRHGDAVGTYCVDRQPLQLGQRDIDAAYRGLLSIAEGHQRHGLGRWLVRSALGWLRENAAPALCYGCVDATNRRALALLAGEGAVPIGELQVFTLYRQFPRRRIAVDTVAAPPAGEVEAMLAASAPCIELADRTPPRGGGAYRVVRGGGEILAGAHVSMTRLDLDPLQGVAGFVVERLMPRFPPGHRRFNPRNFAYLRLNHLYAPIEHAATWPRFIESLMAGHGVHFAVLVLDPTGPTFATLRGAGLPGALSRRFAQRVSVLSAGVDTEAALLDQIRAVPLSLSARDL